MERGKPCFALCPHAASLLGKGFLGCLTSQPSHEYVINTNLIHKLIRFVVVGGIEPPRNGLFSTVYLTALTTTTTAAVHDLFF